MKLQSRFDGWSKTGSAVVLAALLLIMALTAAMSIARIDPSGGQFQPQATHASGQEPVGDAALYRRIATDVAAGKPYYASAARHHRENSYPLKPFVTVRFPTLAVLSAWLGPTLTQLAMVMLLAATAYAWHVRMQAMLPGSNAGPWIVGLIIASGAVLCSGTLLTFHESWAAMLIALSLALWRPGFFAASVIAGLVAVLFRDLAIPYLLLMAVAALIERRWRETAAWTGAIAIVAALLCLHGSAVAGVVQPGDLSSQGWNGMRGWPFYVATIMQTSLLIILPDRLAQALVPLCLFGWIAWKSDYGLRLAGLMCGYGLMLMLFARQENYYWSLLTVPLLFTGLALAPSAVHRLSMQIDPEATARVVGNLRAAMTTARRFINAPLGANPTSQL